MYVSPDLASAATSEDGETETSLIFPGSKSYVPKQQQFEAKAKLVKETIKENHSRVKKHRKAAGSEFADVDDIV